ATWCPPCRAEIPDLLKLYENKDVEILAVDLTNTENSVEDVVEFTKDFEMNTFPVLMDVNADVAVEYQVQAYPTTYMVDSHRRLRFSAMGAMNYDFMVQELEKMEQPCGHAETDTLSAGRCTCPSVPLSPRPALN